MAVSPGTMKRFVRSLTTTSGKYAGQPFNLHPFQEDIIDCCFARNAETKKRLRREVVLGVARKNGKSELMAALGLGLMTVEREPGGLVVLAAAKREQAALILNVAKRMVWQSNIGGTPMGNFIQVRRDSLYFPETDNTMKVIAAEAQKEHGLNPHAFIVDEGHATMEKSRELYDTLLTAQGAREDPLAITITTAGPTPSGPMYDLYKYGKDVQSGLRNDPEFGFLWHEADPQGEIDDPRQWRLANPALGLFLREDFLAKAAKSVKNGKSSEFMFRRLHLNQWTTALERWLPWDKVTQPANMLPPEIPEQAPVFIAIDAALRRDTFAVAVVWVEETHREADDGTSIPHRVVHARVKRFTPPDATSYIDPQEVEVYILGLCEKYQPQRISYDPAYMAMMAMSLAERGLPIEAFPQSAQRMERATESFQRVLLDGRLRHGGDPLLLEQISAVATKPTERGVRISKVRTTMPQDMAVALAMAVDDAVGDETVEPSDFALWVD